MLTAAAARSAIDVEGTVLSIRHLRHTGWTDTEVRAQLRARRWQRRGQAIVLHNDEPDRIEQRAIALLNCGRRAALTAFSAAEELGLTGWERDVAHVLVPGGTHVPTRPAPVRVHYTGAWARNQILGTRRLHRPAPALVLAAATFTGPRPACGILAAGVQQRLTTPAQLESALLTTSRLRHRAALLAAVHDIGQGAQALSEIDFTRLCRRHAIPEPERQAVRTGPGGRRRYVDAHWTRRDGRHVVVEVDGALHLIVRRWWEDQLRQNELVLGNDLVLRYPSVIVRTEPLLVAEQLRRALHL